MKLHHGNTERGMFCFEVEEFESGSWAFSALCYKILTSYSELKMAL